MYTEEEGDDREDSCSPDMLTPTVLSDESTSPLSYSTYQPPLPTPPHTYQPNLPSHQEFYAPLPSPYPTHSSPYPVLSPAYPVHLSTSTSNPYCSVFPYSQPYYNSPMEEVNFLQLIRDL